MSAMNDRVIPLAHLEGSAPLLHVPLTSYSAEPGPVDELRAIVSVVHLQELTALVVAVKGQRNCAVCVLLDPTDPGVWSALDSWRETHRLPVRLAYPLTDFDGDIPLRIDGYVDSLREHLTTAGLPSVQYDCLDSYRTMRKLESMFFVQNVEWRGLQWAGECLILN